MTVHPKLGMLAGLTFFLIGSAAAMAADAAAFAYRLKSIAEKQDIPLAYASAEATGDDVVLKGLRIGKGDGASPPVDMTFKGVTGSDADGWTVKSIPIADIDKTQGPTHLMLKDAVIENVQIAGTGSSKLPGEIGIYFEKASLGAFTVEQGGKPIFSLTGSKLANTLSDEGGIDSEGDFGKLDIDFTGDNTTPEVKAAMSELGYSQMSGGGTVSAGWNPKTGQLSLDPLTVTVEKAGSLDFSYQIDGYTPAFITSLSQIRKQMQANPDQQASGMAILGLASQLSLASIDIGFTDDSLTNKLLDYYGKQNGQTREQMIDGIVGMMPAFLGMLQNPEFQKSVTDAVSAFLKDPKSLTISVDPENPVPATQIIGAAMGAPQTLPAVLDLSVTANDADE